MTTITMQLPDELVQQAKDAGVLNEQTLSELFGQFLQTRISSTATNKAINKPIETKADFFNTNQSLSVPELVQRVGINTDKTATVEEMNDSVAKMFETWECEN